MKVTRIAYSKNLNIGKYVQLEEQARRLGRVRSKVWRGYGSVHGVGVSDRAIRDAWMADGTAATFGVLANAWKETVRDAVADIAANREAAKVKARRAINQRTKDETEQKRLFTALKRETWASDPFLSRQMRQHWKRGRNRTHNQIIVRCDQYKTFTLTDNGNVWLAVPGLERRQLVKIPLNTTVAPTGTLRIILRSGRIEVHYAIDAAGMKSSQRSCGDRAIGVDKGYTEVLTDSDGRHHGTELGKLLTAESNQHKIKGQRRAKLRSIADKAQQRGDRAKAQRIRDNNLGTLKRNRRTAAWQCRVRDITFKAVHAVADKAAVMMAEDLTKTFTGRKKLGKNTNRRLAAWTKGVTAEALQAVSDRRGSAVRLVNAAYTSQVVPFTNILGVRKGDRLDCTACGAVWQADHAAAINILERDRDPDIMLYTPHTWVKQILQERTDRQRSRLPDQDSSTSPCVCGERNIRTAQQRAISRKQDDIVTDTADADRGIMIDAPDTADRDDAIWVRHGDTGYDAWVHIALVAGRLPLGGPGDSEARRRMHSTYLPDRTIGMLPRDVERGTSLSAGTAQATMAVAMRFAPDGELVDTTVGAGTLGHATAISYEAASQALDDPRAPLSEPLNHAHALAKTLLSRRQDCGALALYDLFKGYATNEEGQLVRLGDSQRNAGYIIVQELMIAANTAIAMWCAERDLPILFRNHRHAAVGGSREELAAELAAAEARGDAAAYETLRKRLGVVQRPATYEPAVFGHYGLNLPAYAHATSPLRRYPDLVNQRILMAEAAGEPGPYDRETLDELGADLNERIQAERERRAEHHKRAARKAVREHLDGTDFTALDTQRFSKVLHLALARGTPPTPLADEARRRFETAALSLRDACEIIISGRGVAWRRLRDAINADLAAEPGKALTLVNMYAQSVLGGPVNDSHLVWELASVGSTHRPAFAARLRLELGEVRHASPRRVQLSKKDAKAQAALGLVARIAELDDLSRSIDTPAPTPATPAPREPVPADRHPVMAVNEYAQTGVIDALGWEFDRTGPAHEPTFTCTVTATTDTGTPVKATGTGPGKQAAKTDAAARLREHIEAAFDNAGLPQA